MALISCPNCEKQVSDRAKACPHCGHPVLLEPEVVEEKKVLLCEECGGEIPEGAESCPHCGCPVELPQEPELPAIVEEELPQKVEVTSVNLPKMKSNTKKYVIIAVVAVIAVMAALLMGNRASEKKRLETYGANLENASTTMLYGAAYAEEAGNLIRDVWYNTIYEERDSETDKFTRPKGYFLDDFNDAIANLFADADFQSTLSSIESNQDQAARLMKQLQDPPEEYEEAYDALRDYYNAYTALTNLALQPSGNLRTYSQDFNDADNELINCYKTMQLYLD